MTPHFVPRFGRDADVYNAYRPEYPPQLFDAILTEVPLDRRSCAVDLGAGTGKSTRALLDYFPQVIAVEPDALMAGKLRLSAPRASVRLIPAEDLALNPASVDLVAIAHAVHWMDVPRVTANIAIWLRAGGVLAIWGGEFPDTPEPIRSIVKPELESRWNKFRQGGSRTKELPESIIGATPGLRILPEKTVRHIIPLTTQRFVGYCSSTSYGSGYARSLPDPQAYWRDLESRIRKAWPDETFPVDFSPWLVLARKE
jgi:SAM-dependent methyltransferase